ncbi:MAG TPA: N-formylglutamate amidohydrolase [Nitrospiria bacterium]|jgi:predicted N-formylglutamate amidohydrolase
MGVILTCEHGGNQLPAKYKGYFKTAKAQTSLETHRGYDPGALTVAKALATGFHFPLYANTVTRLLVDLNRSVGHPKLFSEFTRDLHPAERQQLLNSFYYPHRQKIEEKIETMIRRKGTTLHLAIHSFTPRFQGTIRTADIGLLYDPTRQIEKQICLRWKNILKVLTPTLRIRQNYPYRGNADGLTTGLRRLFPEHNYLGIEIEMNQALLAPSLSARKKMASLLYRSFRLLKVCP